MALTHALSTNNYGPAKFIVATSVANGTHTTLTSAMADAVAGETIFIRAGTSLTENVTLKAGVAVTSFLMDGTVGNVVINGTLTMTASGTAVVSGVRLVTNGAACVVVSGANAASVILNNVVIACNGSTGISLTSSNASSSIQLYDCTGDIQSSATKFFDSSSAGTLIISDSNFTNSILSTTASTISAGTLRIDSSTIDFPITSSGTAGVDLQYNILNASALNNTMLTIGGSGTNRSFNDTVSSGTASAISISQSLTTSGLTVNSSNANAITGAGTILYGTIDFTGSSSTINTSTQTPLITKLGTLTAGTPNSGVTNVLTLTNPSNTASSQAQVNVTVGGGTSGDAYTTYTVSGVTNWSEGIDNSDSDAYVLAASSALGTTNVIRASTAGEITYPLQPAFQAYLGTNVTNATGNGAVYTLGSTQALTEVFDRNSDFNTNGTFTAPVTGVYAFQAGVLLLNCTIATTCVLQFLSSGGTNYNVRNERPASALNFGVSGTALMSMTAGQTLTVNFQCTGEAGNTNTIQGAQANTWISGYLVC